MVKLKKRVSFKSSVGQETIRVDAIKKAAKVLQNSEVYCVENIHVDYDEFENIVNGAMNDVIDDCEYDLAKKKNVNYEEDSDDDSIVSIECESVSANSNNENNERDSDDYSTASIECESVSTSSNNENNASKLNSERADSDEFIEINDHEDKCPDDETVLLSNEGISFAPGENNTPRSIFYYPLAESATFIKIYAGTVRKIPEHLTHQKVLQSEILRSDRRCCDPYRLFHAAGMLRIEKMSQKLLICLKRSRNDPHVSLPTTFNRILTASQILNDTFVNNLTLKDCAYKIFEHDRGSPAYFAHKKRELFAMIRQLGPAHVFLTLSSAETKWLELLVILKQTVDNQVISENEAKELSNHERRRLLRSDPVTAARYFRHKLKCIFKLLKNGKNCLFGEHYVVDFYIRTEYSPT